MAKKAGKAVARKKSNPVAKYAAKFNRAAKHKDRKKAQKRGVVKHRATLVEGA